MSHLIAIHWDDQLARCLVLREESSRTKIVAQLSVPTGSDEPSAIGRRLAQALAPFRSGRANAVATLGRSSQQWQHLTLPPCPVDELPDLVRLQANHETAEDEDAPGHDFLPFAGDEQTSHQVLAISADSVELQRLLAVCRAADLRLERIVPLTFGWPVLIAQGLKAYDQDNSLFVATAGDELILWAKLGGRLAMIRQITLAQPPEADPAPLLGEIRRSLLALNQSRPEQPVRSIWLTGPTENNLQPLVQPIDEQLDQSVRWLDLDEKLPPFEPEALAQSTACETLPLLGVALDEVAGQAPLVDLLHPRRRPAPRTSRRTYGLAVAVAASLLALFCWHGFRQLNAPLDAAALAEMELKLLEQSQAGFDEDKRRWATIRDWQGGSINVLDELQNLAEKLRPAKLSADDFPLEQDIVVSRVQVNGKQINIDALARSNAAVQPFEQRLRDSSHRVLREKVDRDNSLPNYPWHFRATVEVSEPTGLPEEEAR